MNPTMTLRQDSRGRVRIPADYRTDDGCAFETSVIDLSEEGCRLSSGVDRLTPGTGLSIAIDRMAPVSARVLWQYGPFCGLAFTRRMDPALVQHLRHSHARGPLRDCERPRP